MANNFKGILKFYAWAHILINYIAFFLRLENVIIIRMCNHWAWHYGAVVTSSSCMHQGAIWVSVHVLSAPLPNQL